MLPLAHSERLLGLLGQKEDVEKAPGLRPGLATRKAQIQLGQGPGNRPAHEERVCWQIHPPGASWMFKARNVTGWPFHKNPDTFSFDNWVFTAEYTVGFQAVVCVSGSIVLPNLGRGRTHWD